MMWWPVYSRPQAAALLFIGALSAGCEAQPLGHDPTCGDGVAEGNEACDGDDVRGQTCESFELRSGRLGCTPACEVDTGECLPPWECGDGVAEGDEECDGWDLRGNDCGSLGCYGGTLSCRSDCTFELSSCAAAGCCGDGLLNAPPGFPEEICDDGNRQDWDGCTACQPSEIRVNEPRDPALDPEYEPRARLGTVAMGATGDVLAMWWVDYWYHWSDPPFKTVDPLLRQISRQGTLSETVIWPDVYGAGDSRAIPQTIALSEDSEGNVLMVWWLCEFNERIYLRWVDPSLNPLGDQLGVAEGGGCGGELWPLHARVTGPTEAIVVWQTEHPFAMPGIAVVSRLQLNQPVDSQIELELPVTFPSRIELPLFPGYRYDMTSNSYGFLLAWNAEDPFDPSEPNVYVRRYSPGGAHIEPDIFVSDTLGPGAKFPRVAAWPDGRFLVTYARPEDATNLPDGAHDVYGRLYASDGSPLTGELLLNEDLEGDQGGSDGGWPLRGFPDAVLCEDGTFYVFWIGEGHGLDSWFLGTFGRRFHSDGTPLGPEKLLGSEVGREAGLLFDTRVAADSSCQRLAAVSLHSQPGWNVLVARLNASLDLIGAESW